jgi:hypothetical protein
MSSFYAEMQDVASELLSEFKQGVVTLKRPGTTIQGVNPWDPPIASDTVEIMLDATVRGVASQFVDGSTIMATDLQVMIAVPSVEPSMTDQLMIDGKAVQVLRIDPVPAAGAPAAYRLIVRA